MNKVLAKNGARHNLEQLFTDLQTYIKNGIANSLGAFIETFGIIAERAQDGTVAAADTTLKASYTTPGFINIAAGTALTENLEFLDVESPQTFALPGTNGVHTLYIYSSPDNSGYTAVMNGFKYTAGENLTPTREIDGYDFAWDTVTSGLLIADITVSGVVVTAIDDRRDENLFVLKTDPLPGYVVRTDFTDRQTISGPVTVTTSLKVGGSEVLTEGTAPTKPELFVIKDVLPAEIIEHIDTTMDAFLPIDTKKAMASTNVTVKLAWGIVNATATDGGGGGILTIPQLSYISTVPYSAANALVGLHLYHHTWNKDYEITVSSYATNTYTITIRNLDGSTPSENLAGTVTIHDDAEFYEIVAIPYDTGQQDRQQIREWSIKYTITDVNGNLVVFPEATVDLPLGQKYSISVRSCTQFMKSAYQQLNSNCSYTKEEEPLKYENSGVVSYTIPYITKIALLNNSNASVTATPTYAGFKVAINPGTTSSAGWTLATAYEVLYTSATGGVNLTTPNYQRVVTNHTEVEISTPGRYTYGITVRPLVGGQVAVSTGLSTTVVSGGGGAAPNDSIIVQTPINFRTFQGIIDATIYGGTGYGGGSEHYSVVRVKDVVTPAYSGLVSESVSVVNGTFGSNIAGWTNFFGYDMTSGHGNTAWVNAADWGGITGGHVKMGVNSTADPMQAAICQEFVIPSGVSSIEMSFEVSYEGSTPQHTLGVMLRQSIAGTAAPCAATNLYQGTIPANFSAKTTKTISASIPTGTVGKTIYLVIYATGGQSGYFHIDNVTGTWTRDTNTSRTVLTREIIGEVFSDETSGRTYIVADILDQNDQGTTMVLRAMNGSTADPTVNSIFRIGTTERGRTVYVAKGLLIDYEITKAYFDCDVLVGRKCRMRWYQEGVTGKALADSLLITGSDVGFVQTSDVVIKEDYGDRNIIVDLYDDGTDPDNYSGVTGTIVIFGRPALN
jgi:hypothetical protein